MLQDSSFNDETLLDFIFSSFEIFVKNADGQWIRTEFSRCFVLTDDPDQFRGRVLSSPMKSDKDRFSSLLFDN